MASGTPGRYLLAEAIQQAMVIGYLGPDVAKLGTDGRVAPGDLAANAPGQQAQAMRMAKERCARHRGWLCRRDGNAAAEAAQPLAADDGPHDDKGRQRRQ